MLQHLDREGYAVIESVATNHEIMKAKELFWQYLEQPRVAPGMDINRNDWHTWNNWIGNEATGIIGSPYFNHSDFSWFGRLLPKVQKTFSEVWFNTSQSHSVKEADQTLIVSFDAGNAFRPWKKNSNWVTNRNWWHVDQNSLIGKHRQGKQCVQGLITYLDVTQDTGGFCCIPRSHLLHDDICSRSPSAQTMHDYVYLETNDPILQRPSSMEPSEVSGEECFCAILPLAHAGDLIIWDSRLIHCNTPGLTAPSYNEGPATLSDDIQFQETNDDNVDLLRLVSYVCMLPRSFADETILNNKKKAFLSSTPTSHWPTQNVTVFCREKSQYRDMASCSDEMLRLSGFTEKEICDKKFYDQDEISCCVS